MYPYIFKNLTKMKLNATIIINVIILIKRFCLNKLFATNFICKTAELDINITPRLARNIKPTTLFRYSL